MVDAHQLYMLYEGLKANSSIVIIPSSAVESMDLGGLSGMTALTMGIAEEQRKGEAVETVPASSER